MERSKKLKNVGAVEPPEQLKGAKVINMKLAAAVAGQAFPQMTYAKGEGVVKFGNNNDFPQYIIALNSKSPVNKAIIDSTVTYICGKGVRDSRTEGGKYLGQPNPKESWDDLIEKIARDYKTFGGFYLQIVKNKDSKTVSIFHQDYSAVRIQEADEFGEPLTFVLAAGWPKTQKSKRATDIPAFTKLSDMEDGKSYMFHHWDYEPGLTYYSLPDYYAATEYIKADGTLAEFYNNSIENGFTPSVVISMPSNPSDTQKEAFQKQMEDAFAGSKGANSIVILWGENKAIKPEITPFQASANANVFNEVEKIVFQKIMSANRLSSPTLAGVSGSGNLSGNAAEIVDSFVLYNYTVVEKKRRRILDVLNQFTKINGTRALVIDELDVLPKIKETESPDSVAPTVTEGGEESLASKLGVGGTQALTAIMDSPNLPEDKKRGMLAVIFGLSEEELDTLFEEKAEAANQAKRGRLRSKNPLNKLLKKIA